MKPTIEVKKPGSPRKKPTGGGPKDGGIVEDFPSLPGRGPHG